MTPESIFSLMIQRKHAKHVSANFSSFFSASSSSFLIQKNRSKRDTFCGIMCFELHFLCLDLAKVEDLLKTFDSTGDQTCVESGIYTGVLMQKQTNKKKKKRWWNKIIVGIDFYWSKWAKKDHYHQMESLVHFRLTSRNNESAASD